MLCVVLEIPSALTAKTAAHLNRILTHWLPLFRWLKIEPTFCIWRIYGHLSRFQSLPWEKVLGDRKLSLKVLDTTTKYLETASHFIASPSLQKHLTKIENVKRLWVDLNRHHFGLLSALANYKDPVQVEEEEMEDENEE